MLRAVWTWHGWVRSRLRRCSGGALDGGIVRVGTVHRCRRGMARTVVLAVGVMLLRNVMLVWVGRVLQGGKCPMVMRRARRSIWRVDGRQRGTCGGRRWRVLLLMRLWLRWVGGMRMWVGVGWCGRRSVGRRRGSVGGSPLVVHHDGGQPCSQEGETRVRADSGRRSAASSAVGERTWCKGANEPMLGLPTWSRPPSGTHHSISMIAPSASGSETDKSEIQRRSKTRIAGQRMARLATRHG